MILFKKGDLFYSTAQALAHGCNTTGRMGAGIAKEFKKRYHTMYKDYMYLCGIGKFDPGTCYTYNTSDNKYIFNLATQDSLSGAKVEYVKSAFNSMKDEMVRLNIKSVAMPKIGCGLGGLNWDTDILPILEDTFNNKDILIEVWEL